MSCNERVCNRWEATKRRAFGVALGSSRPIRRAATREAGEPGRVARRGVGPNHEAALAEVDESKTIPTFCALCVSRCGARATVRDGELVSLEPDRAHPTGSALCIKGKAAPELVAHPDRLLHPMKRTRPKGEDPGWQRISWEEAIDTTARRLLEISRESGPESVAFSVASPSTSALSDAEGWIRRLVRAFGSPNLVGAVELCAWGRYFAPLYTFGASVPGEYLPDLDHAGCILFWGYNPSVARLAHATQTNAALKRGARLIVVDPRRAGMAKKADLWLRVRPGTDAALALGITHVMIERGWFDEQFVCEWTDAPLLVRSDNGRLLRGSELEVGGDSNHYVAWHAEGRPVFYDSKLRRYEAPDAGISLSASVVIPTTEGEVSCRTVFQILVDACKSHDPKSTEQLTGVSAEDVERTARMLWEARPVAYYAWSGVEQHTNNTQTARAIAQLYALTGCLDAEGGNVLFAKIPANDVAGAELLPAAQRAKALGLARSPLGPGRFELPITNDLYTAALESRPYRVRGLVGFGANLLLASADSRRGRQALAALDFYVHADPFMSPTAQMADVVLPVVTPFESEGLRLGFEISQPAQSLLQLRKPLVKPRGEARSDIAIIFALAQALGLGRHFWDGDIDAAYRYQLEPSGVSLERLRQQPAGVRLELETRHRKFAESVEGRPRGFRTPSGKIELYSETLLEHGQPPMPTYQEPLVNPRANVDWMRKYPLILTCAKEARYLESQLRALPTLRKQAPDPVLEIHPETARARGVRANAWVRIQTPDGSVRARARFNETLAPDVVCGQHGWWQACSSIGAPGFDPFGSDGANLNLVISHRWTDPVSGTAPHRSYVCNIEPV